MVNSVLSAGILVSGVAAPATSTAVQMLGGGRRTYHAVVAGSGAVTATATVQVSNDNLNWLTLASISLSGTTTVSEGFYSEAPWAYHRVDLTAISGTSAAFSVYFTREGG